MATKALFLDFYGTVVEEDNKYITKICYEVASSSTITTTADEVGYFWWKEFLSMYTDSYGERFQKQRDIQTSSLEKTISNFHSYADAEDLCSILFTYGQKPVIFNDSKEFLDRVSIPIVIVSNIDNQDIMVAIKEHMIEVDHIVTSEDARCYKPGVEIFELALNTMGLDAAEVIHIGDSWSSDIIGAGNAGIRSIWLNRKNKVSGNGANPIGICSNLLEVLNYVS